MDNNTALTDPTATQVDNMQLWVDLQAELATLRVAMEDAADDYGPGAGNETTVCQA